MLSRVVSLVLLVTPALLLTSGDPACHRAGN